MSMEVQLFSALSTPFAPLVMLEALLALHKVIVNSPNVQWLLKLSYLVVKQYQNDLSWPHRQAT